MIAGPDGRSNGTESENPTTAASSALSHATREDAAHASREQQPRHGGQHEEVEDEHHARELHRERDHEPEREVQEQVPEVDP